jgi:hypothetical protein
MYMAKWYKLKKFATDNTFIELQLTLTSNFSINVNNRRHPTIEKGFIVPYIWMVRQGMDILSAR